RDQAMNILMMTNTFAPHVGGVARSVEAFSNEYRKRGHRVLIVAPEFENTPKHETNVIRVHAIQHFNGSDFSVALPSPAHLTAAVKEFGPEIVHSHHPFLIGTTALRIAHTYGIPLVFTHHTKYEQYTHYVPGDSAALKRFVIRLSTNYANLCNQVFAPSESIAEVIGERGVHVPVDVVPTGVKLEQYSHLDGSAFRRSVDIPDDAFVVGHVGRLAAEKNLEFLTDTIVTFLKAEPHAHFLLVGEGPMETTIRSRLASEGLGDRLYATGILTSSRLRNAYAAMDVFAFASKSETQGMVLTEAMAAAVPVVAIDAAGVREVVRDRQNGRLLHTDNVEKFALALRWLASMSHMDASRLKSAARKTAEAFSMERSAGKAVNIYTRLRERGAVNRHCDYHVWTNALHVIEAEWGMLKGVANAAAAAIGTDPGI
ncbi:MAG: glycosyltransferase, partial [Gammaproteobacteria bacterium]